MSAGLPELPYAGTSGWSGSDTSQARAARDDTDGTTRNRQATVLRVLAAAGEHGATWKEVADATGFHHGNATGALSVLHKTGRINRLTETRNKCKVYVLPDNTAGRAVEAHGRRTGTTTPTTPVEADLGAVRSQERALVADMLDDQAAQYRDHGNLKAWAALTAAAATILNTPPDQPATTPTRR